MKMTAVYKVFAIMCLAFCLAWVGHCVCFYVGLLDVSASAEMAEQEQNKAEVVEISNTTKSMYSEQNLELLAHLLMGESGADYCSDQLMFYVGSVAINRVISDDFPNTLEEVIYQPGQYACTWDGNFDLEPTDRCWQIAQELLDNGPVLPTNVVFQAQFTQGSSVYVKEQNMYFCTK